jgi:hypothetical protein
LPLPSAETARQLYQATICSQQLSSYHRCNRSARSADNGRCGSVFPLRPLRRGMPRGDQAMRSDRTERQSRDALPPEASLSKKTVRM